MDVDSLKSLILTVSMRPHAITSWQEAVCLWYKGAAEILEEYEATVSSVSMTIHVPAVVRLNKSIADNKKGVKFSRGNILTRDGFRCCYCGKRKSPKELNYDHVVPRSKGGRTTWTNIVSSCISCNRKKGARLPKEAGLTMHFLPYRPKILPMAQPLLFDPASCPDEWRPYIAFLEMTA